jgi:phosphate/sulfate permease
LGLWWTLWLTNGVIGNGLFRLSMKAKTLDQLTSITSGYMILHIIGIALAFITLKVITDYAKIEPLLHEKQL